MSLTKKKTSFIFDASDYLRDLDPEEKLDKKEKIAEYIIDSIVDYVGNGKSPVTGKSFKGLSKDYKKFKEEEAGNTNPNMELYGDMLDSLDFKIKGNKIEIGIFDPDQAVKSFNHNTGDTIPKRQFIPDEGESLLGKIVQKIEKL